MSDETSASPATGSDATASTPPVNPAPTPKKPITQGRPGIRDRLPDSSFAWFKQLPTFRLRSTADFQLIPQEELNALLVGVSPAVAQRICDDIQFMEQDLLRMFRALGDDTRLRLLQRLRGGEQCVCDLTDELDTRQSLLSFHLRTLKDAGLVTDRRDGRWVYYALNPDGLETLRRALDELRPSDRALRVLRRCD